MLLLIFLFIGISLSLAQVKVTGTVTSSEDKQPIVGASVLAKGTTVGTITDMDGKFVLPNVPESAKTLVISYIGMKTKEVGIQSNLKIILDPDTKVLDEIVVTAMGMKRSEKTLGYAATTVKAENLDLAKSGSVMGGLSGKVAGVQITAAGDAGSSQKVLIRGISSLNSNAPLYIVDGVPINNSRSGNNDADFGNAANDINSEDVESVTVLKGASATALYGSRASNGVIMITTKKAGVEKLSVTYDGSFFASNVLRVMQTQNLYGQGWGSWDRHENGSWGSRLDGTIHEWGADGKYLSTGEAMTKPYSYVKHNLRDFYQTGLEMNNNLTLRYGTEKLGIVASYGNLKSNGIMPNNTDKYSRNTFSLRGYAKIDKFSFDMSMNYVRKDIRRPEQMYQELLQHGVDVGFKQMKDYNDERYNFANYYTWYANNPYWMLDNYYYTYQDDRVYGKMEGSYDIMKGLKATVRVGGDFSNSRQENMEAKENIVPGTYAFEGGKAPEKGKYSRYAYNRGEIDATALLNGDYKLGEDFSLNATAGWNLNQRTYQYTGGYVEGLDIPGWYNLKNTTSSAISDQYNSKRRLIGAFGQAELGFKNYLFLNLSARNDWSSTLPKGKNSYFYGGANISMIVTELLPSLKENNIDFLKVRAAVGQTGSDADVFKTVGWYNPVGQAYQTYNYTNLPLNGVSGLTENTTKPSTDLRPEMTTEYEFGVSGNFFKNRLSIDFAYYNKNTKDQIISANLGPETGYMFQTKNVGKIQNKGIELAVGVTPVRTKDWDWNVGITYTMNRSKVKELWEGLTSYTYTNWRGVQYVLEIGKAIGQFYTPDVKTVTDKNSPYYGYSIVNNNGFLQAASTSSSKGTSEAKFLMGFNTTLKYKNFTFSAAADWRFGGVMVSNTSYITHFDGNSTETLFNERYSFIYPHSVKTLSDGSFVENNIMVKSSQMNYAQGNYSYNPLIRDAFLVSKSYFKLRELALYYNFPQSILSHIGFIQNATLGIVGRNLLLFTPRKNNYIDPETTNLGNDLLSEFGETTGTSSTRNFGVNVKVVF